MLSLFLACALGACPSDDPDDDVRDTSDALGDDGDATDALGDVAPDAADTLVDSADTRETLDTNVATWPWPAEVIEVPASAHWKGAIGFPDEPFASQSQGFDRPQPRWVKLTVFVGDPTRAYFQDSVTHPFHLDFALHDLPPFAGMDADAFDAATLDNSPGKRAILASVMFAPAVSWGGPPLAREVGVTLVGHDPYPAIVTSTVLELVRDHLTASDGGAPPAVFYFPAWEQQAQAAIDAERLAALGFVVSGPERWATGDTCYARGWALGRLVAVPADEIDVAYGDGRLGPDDILLTDGVPAEVPFVAGIVTTAPSTPSSHVAILAATFGVPFVHLATDGSRAAAEALVGRLVALRARGWFGQGPTGGCDVSFVDVEGRMSADELAAVQAIKAAEPLDFPARATLGALARDAALLTAADIAHFGGKAAHFGLLRRTIPEASPAPAIGLSFDLWDRVIGPARAQIDARLDGHAWPADVAALRADLAAVRDIVKGLSIPADVAGDVRAALEAAGFDASANIRFRSSTNVEDQASFTGAGLYDSYSGCLADDTDGDEAGPSRCDPSEPDERGVMRAVKKVYASFWNDNAFMERLRHGVDEDDVAMGLLVHPSAPDPIERANGVATLQGGGGSSQITLVTQLGAVSVANPDGAAAPEVVTAGIYSFGTYLETLQTSALVPLGGHVMRWEDDYQALAALIERVGEAWKQDVAGPSDPFWLDLEYKLVERTAGEPRLEVKQVRPLPIPGGERTQATFLLPEAPVHLCTFQGEHGAVFGNWRLKSRVTLEHDGRWLDAAGRATTVYSRVRVERAGVVPLDGAPSGLPGASHEPGSSDQWGNPQPMIDGWVLGVGDARQAWTLQTSLPWVVAESELPLVVLGDAWISLDVTWATPQLEPDQWPDGTTTYDSTRLVGCPEDTVLTPLHLPVHRTATTGPDGVDVDIRFWWPPAPTGITAGYTAPLAKWDVTRITGLTSTPIELVGYWSQTYRPGHHNFSESFIFEPALEEGIDPALVAELEAADVRAIVVHVGFSEGTIDVVGLDGRLRSLSPPPRDDR
ncbi:MAG: hypothetical protein IT385_30390 [Deltaproteobacteria bacterium]|nr:hypothetical protein [Deltaproteobacteria bacterium]